MERKNLIIVYDNDLVLYHGFEPIVSPDFEGDIIIHGNLDVRGNVIFNGRLWVIGDIKIYGELEVDSVISKSLWCFGLRAQDAYCFGDIDTTDIIISGNLYCKQTLSSDVDLQVFGNVSCGNFDTLCSDVSIDQDFIVTNGKLIAGDLTVHGNVSAQSSISAAKVDVHGNLNTGGDFNSSFHTQIGGNLFCKNITTSAFLCVEGSITCANINAQNIFIGNKLSCKEIRAKSIFSHKEQVEKNCNKKLNTDSK